MKNKIAQHTLNRLNHQLHLLQRQMIEVTLPDIERAREFSNNEENDDLMHAKMAQSQLETRIEDLNKLIKGSELVTSIEFNGSVTYGTEVHIQNEDTGIQRWIKIVGEMEGTSASEISFKSPLGLALEGHREGDQVEITIPAGTQTWNILEVKVSNVFAQLQGRV